MGAFSSAELKAIGYYAETNHWKLSLSTYPTVYFIDEDGKTVKVNIEEIVDAYDEHTKEVSRERARQRAQERQKQKEQKKHERNSRH